MNEDRRLGITNLALLYLVGKMMHLEGGPEILENAKVMFGNRSFEDIIQDNNRAMGVLTDDEEDEEE